MEIALVIYLISLADTVGAGLVVSVGTIVLLSLFISTCLIDFSMSAGKEKNQALLKNVTKHAKVGAILLLLVSIFVWLVPDKETSYTILAAYGVTEVLQSERVQQLGPKSLKVLEAHMDKYLEDTNLKEPVNAK